MLKLLAVHHIAVICSDYERSKRFYTEVLGLRVVRETWREQRRSFKLDLRDDGAGLQVELFSFPGAPPRPSYPEACGLRHLALAVADVHAAAEAVRAQGVAVEPVRVDEHTGRPFTFFADPDGLPIELYQQETAPRG